MDESITPGRHPSDFYETAPWMPLQLLKFCPYPIAQGSVVCEVAAGEGAIVEVLTAERPDLQIITNDLNPDRPTDLHFDARNAAKYPDGIDWIITNPPFSAAAEIVRASLEHARVGVAMLLPLTWSELIRSRRDLLTYPKTPRVINLAKRYCFRRGRKTGRWQTAPVTHCWFIWHRESIRTSPIRSIEFIPGDEEPELFTRNPEETLKRFPEGYRAFVLGGGLTCTEPVSDRHLQPSLWSPTNGRLIQPPPVQNQVRVLAENPAH